jgi:hypothetical protein
MKVEEESEKYIFMRHTELNFTKYVWERSMKSLRRWTVLTEYTCFSKQVE